MRPCEDAGVRACFWRRRPCLPLQRGASGARSSPAQPRRVGPSRLSRATGILLQVPVRTARHCFPRPSSPTPAAANPGEPAADSCSTCVHHHQRPFRYFLHYATSPPCLPGFAPSEPARGSTLALVAVRRLLPRLTRAAPHYRRIYCSPCPRRLACCGLLVYLHKNASKTNHRHF